MDAEDYDLDEIHLRVSEVLELEPKEKIELPDLIRDRGDDTTGIYSSFDEVDLLAMEVGDKVVDGDKIFMVTWVDNKESKDRRKVKVVAVNEHNSVSGVNGGVTEVREYSVRWQTEERPVGRGVVPGTILWTPQGWQRVLSSTQSKDQVVFGFKNQRDWVLVKHGDTKVTIRGGAFDA